MEIVVEEYSLVLIVIQVLHLVFWVFVIYFLTKILRKKLSKKNSNIK